MDWWRLSWYLNSAVFIADIYLMNRISSNFGVMSVIIKTMAEVDWSGDLFGSFFLAEFCTVLEDTVQLAVEELFHNTMSDKMYWRPGALIQCFAVNRDTWQVPCLRGNIFLLICGLFWFGFFPALLSQRKDTSTSRNHSPAPGPSTLWWFGGPMFLFTIVTKIL